MLMSGSSAQQGFCSDYCWILHTGFLHVVQEDQINGMASLQLTQASMLLVHNSNNAVSSKAAADWTTQRYRCAQPITDTDLTRCQQQVDQWRWVKNECEICICGSRGCYRDAQITSEMMDAMSVVAQLRDLASEPQNREAIAKDEGCLPGLVLFLGHKNPQVVFATLQTLRYLAESSQNIISMKNELGMMVSLETLIKKSELSAEITDLAKEVHEVLSCPERTETLRTPVQPMRRNKHQFFINSSNKKAKTVTLHIQGLEGTDQRGVCEEALLKVKGVISFTFEMAMRRCTVRVRADVPTESLASAIAATKVLSAQQVVKNETGEEVFLPLTTTDTHVEQNHHLPDYLPEDESPEKEMDRAVSRTAAKQDASGSWLSSAASFLTKTFYW